MTPESENKLMIVERSLATFRSNPVAQVEIARKINSKAYEVFEIDRLLSELNKKLFEGKGEIIPVNQAASIKPEVNQDQDSEQQSRFKRLFTLGYQTEETSLGAELYIKRENLPGTLKSSKLEGVGIKVYQVVNIKEENLSIHVLGKLYFSVSRSSNGRWDNSPTFLNMQSQGKFFSFSLHSIPPAEEVRRSFWENTTQILRDLSDNNFIPPIDPESDDTTSAKGGSRTPKPV